MAEARIDPWEGKGDGGWAHSMGRCLVAASPLHDMIAAELLHISLIARLGRPDATVFALFSVPPIPF